MLKLSAALRPFCVALSPSVHWHAHFFYCCALYIYGFRQWLSRTDQVVNLNMTIRLALFWRTARTCPHVWACTWAEIIVILAHLSWLTARSVAYILLRSPCNFFLGFRQWRSRADRVVNLNMTIRPPLFWRTCRASELTDRQVRLVSCFFYSWFLENTEKMKASAETFLRLMPSTGPQCMNSNSLTRVWKGPSVLVMQSSTTLGSQQAWARDWNTHDFKDACQLPHSSWDRNKSP